MPKFGGHAMAAGVTLAPGGFAAFRDAFEVEAAAALTDDLLRQHLDVDGSLTGQELSVDVAKSLSGPPWGQMFPEPVFYDEFDVLEAKLAGPYKDQLNMLLCRDGVTLKATRFRHDGELPGTTVKLVYKLNLTRNKFGKDELKLLVDSVC
jgi:single-stranded-DNA-specific exonuclease